MAKPRTTQPVKIPGASLELLRDLSAFTARNGWAALGIDRDDPPTLTALLEEAVRLLAERRDLATAKGKAKR